MIDKMGDNGKFLELLAVAVAGGQTVRAAAKACSCSARHSYRVSATTEFKTRVSELRSEMTNAAVGSLSAAAAEAVAVFRELLANTNEPSIRLNASKSILNALGPMSELGELRERLGVLESER